MLGFSKRTNTVPPAIFTSFLLSKNPTCVFQLFGLIYSNVGILKKKDTRVLPLTTSFFFQKIPPVFVHYLDYYTVMLEFSKRTTHRSSVPNSYFHSKNPTFFCKFFGLISSDVGIFQKNDWQVFRLPTSFLLSKDPTGFFYVIWINI